MTVTKGFFVWYYQVLVIKTSLGKDRLVKKSVEQTSKTSKEFHLKKPKQIIVSPRNVKNTIKLIKDLSAFNFLKGKIFE